MRTSMFMAAASCIALFNGACAPTSQTFYADKTKFDPTSMCRAYLDPNTSTQFRQDLGTELVQRGFNPGQCQGRVGAQNAAIGVAAVIGLATVAAIACSRGCSGLGGGGGGYVPVGYGVAWDQFHDQYGNLVWGCRDRATGEFVDAYQCTGYQVDSTWPGD